MPTWNEKDLGKILTATEESMTDQHFEARLTLVEDGLTEFRSAFKEHTKHEETAFKDLNHSLQAMTNAISETNSIIRENVIKGNAELDKCSANLRRDIMKEVYEEFAKRTKSHNKDCDRVWQSIRNTNDEVAANKLKLVSLMDSHELLKKIQYAVAIAVVMAVLKATGVV